MIKLANQESIDLVTRLIRADFDKIDVSQEYIFNKSQELINAARHYGLADLAVEMETDKRTEIC